MIDPLIAEWIDKAAQQSTAWWDLAGRLRTARGDDGPALDPHVVAFDYLLTERGTEFRERSGALAPKGEFENGTTYPPRVEDAPEETVEAWRAATSAVSSPLARSRYADLLWQRKGPGAHLHARAAIDAYLELVGSDGELRLTTAWAAGARAAELALALRDEELQRRVGLALAEAARASLERAEPEPGLTYRLVAAAAQLPPGAQPPGLDALLEALQERYDDHPRLINDVADLRASRAPDDTSRREVRAWQVGAWERLAAGANGLVRLFHLRRAFEVAQLHHLTEETRQLLRRMQAMEPTDLDLRAVETEVTVDAAPIRRVLEAIVGEDNFFAMLRRMVDAFGPPSGDYDRNVDLVESQMRESPLAYMFPTIVRGPENTTLAELREETEHRQAALRQQEGIGIAWFAIHIADTLDRGVGAYGLPARDELVAFFTSPFIERPVADRMAHALTLFVAGDHDASAHVLAPRLERAIRHFARQVGLVVTKEPQGATAGGVRPLGEVLSQLAGHLDESWRRYLFNLLADPLGHNLRNEIGHGLLDQAQRIDAAMLLHAAVVLTLLEPVEQGVQRAGADDGSDPT